MASRYSAARPRRDGEQFARTHHNEDDDDGVSSKRVKFDVRNPSTLAPESREEDAFLDADVIGGTGATKRGAVNIDGYDSDSDNETFNARAQERRRGKIDINEQLDNYDARGDIPQKPEAAGRDDDGDEDMFAASDDDDKVKDGGGEGKLDDNGDFDKSGHKKKQVHYMEDDQIQGEENYEDAGGLNSHLDKDESSDDEDDVDLRAQEEDVDDEVGAGGLRRNAPKIEAFNLKNEMEEGRFDQSGNYIRRAGDPDAEHDKWLDGTGKKEIRKAAEAHKRREAEARQRRIDEDSILVPELLKDLIVRLEMSETPLEALARLGKSQTKTKKVPKWKLKKQKGGMDVEDDGKKKEEDPEQVRIKENIRAITEAADKLLSRDHGDIYDQEREVLIREYQRETGEEWVEPKVVHNDDDDNNTGATASDPDILWEFKWTDGRDGGGVQGPFDGPTMKAWQDAGYFGEGVEFRPVQDGAEWRQGASFA
ncbi:CD2 antigen cytoplasmic tail-binding protein 2 [Geosmithia morbida]|uniref:CD2 antigen cytoplasmic tail-binding protein 2 n=1 Tax=Geosmithia morbida TaxID=1094350 RepID=A0A9P5D858_9HYPO|nr:CD2 antigen cytoplasmic tail-binding protein 2 [Geosmithia morbida]KAF4126455.1 CD2 antigen cytoplasmic tail-binding protein 2 [Geosmithia morbida]